MAEPAMSMNATLIGATALKAKVRRMKAQTDETILVGLLAGGEVIRDQAVENVTNHGLRMSGTLARSLHVEPEAGL